MAPKKASHASVAIPESEDSIFADAKVPNDTKKLLAKQWKREVTEDWEEQRKWLEENIPGVTEEQFVALLPEPLFEDGWSEEMEEELQRDWNTNPLKDHIRNANHDSLLSVWKASVNYMGCIPAVILPFEHFVVVTQSRAGPARPERIWGDSFCRLLVELVLHPMFERQPKLLRVAIQLAVSLHCDHRGTWPSFVFPWDGFLAGLLQNLRRRTAQQTIVEVFDETLGQMNDDGYYMLEQNPWVRLFQSLQLATWNGQLGDGTCGRFEVRTRDLSSLVACLNKTWGGAYGRRSPLDAQTWAKLVITRGKRLLPSMVHVRGALERVEQARLRWWRSQELRREDDDGEGGSNDVSDNESSNDSYSGGNYGGGSDGGGSSGGGGNNADVSSGAGGNDAGGNDAGGSSPFDDGHFPANTHGSGSPILGNEDRADNETIDLEAILDGLLIRKETPDYKEREPEDLLDWGDGT